jgi:large subunit ribosomal protein L10
MARADKVAVVADLSQRFRSANGTVLADYRGLTVAQLAELRRSLTGKATFTVVKNTLTKRAAADAGVAEQLEELLTGPSAVAFISGDVVEAVKGLRDFARANPALVLKGGILEGRPVAPAEIERLADLESREVLLATLAGVMKASLARAAATMAALPAQMARLAAALEAKQAALEGKQAAPPEPAGQPAAVAAGEPAAVAAGAEPAS